MELPSVVVRKGLFVCQFGHLCLGLGKRTLFLEALTDHDNRLPWGKNLKFRYSLAD
jgi:hypothetical protein